MKKLIVFDLDGTLAPSKSSVDEETASLLHDLLGIVQVAVISGGAWTQFETQMLSHLPRDQRLTKLSILPTCGTQFFQYTTEWKKLYSEDFTADEKNTVVNSLKQAVATAGPHWASKPRWKKSGNGTRTLPGESKSRPVSTHLFPSFRFASAAPRPSTSPDRASTKPTE